MLKKPIPHCLRCGIEKRKGFYEGGCSHWGKYYPRHYWNTHLKSYSSKGGELENEKVS